MKAKYYYESHVTIEPVNDIHLCREISRRHKFKLADLFMLKDRKETSYRSNRDTFMTGHGLEYDDIKDRTHALVMDLTAAGVKVFRYKIEDTLIDSRNEDLLSLL